ncbi:DNA/RNA helicase domain-containing protein, partial [Bacillus altitudinis]|uniref:DNA/RNA helicase domain-containing protein n=1 Tax=Bacillus altitudinis TaxID=293387 RepID=UPI003B51EDDF
MIKPTKITILIFHPKHLLKINTYSNQKLLHQITNTYHPNTLKLTQHIPIHAHTHTFKSIHHFLSKPLLTLPKKQQSFQLKIFHNPNQFKTAIQQKHNQLAFSPILSTF